MKKLFLFIAAALVSTSLLATDVYYIVSNKAKIPLTAGMSGTTTQFLKLDGTLSATTDISITTDGSEGFYYNSTTATYSSLTSTSNYSTGSGSNRTMSGYKLGSGKKLTLKLGSTIPFTKLDVMYACSSKDSKNLTIAGTNYNTQTKDVQKASIASNVTGDILIENSSDKDYYVFCILTATKTYSITFNANGHGTAPTAITGLNSGATPSAPTAPTATGYTFDSWWNKASCSTEDGAAAWVWGESAVTKDTTLYAKWNINSHSLSWNFGEGGSTTAVPGDDYTAEGTLDYGTTINYPADNTMSNTDEGKEFAGWDTIATTMPDKNLTITALWSVSHSISYDNLNGQSVEGYPTKYYEGIGIASFDDLADTDDEHFTGWSPSSIGTDATTPQTISATWEAKKVVTFMNGESTYATQKVVKGEKTTKPVDPLAVGYVFEGWYKESTFDNEWDFDNDVVTQDTVLFAKLTSFTKHAEIIFATSGTAPVNKNDTALLAEGSHGGFVTFVGAKNGEGKYNDSFVYTSSGLALQGSGKDSIKVELKSTLQAGSYIQLDMYSGGTTTRGLKIRKAGQGEVYNASWTPSANGEHNIITYKVTNSDGLVGKNTFWLHRNNTVYLKQIIIGNWYVNPTSLDNTADEIKAVKFFENGQLYIRRGEKVYTITGELVK